MDPAHTTAPSVEETHATPPPPPPPPPSAPTAPTSPVPPPLPAEVPPGGNKKGKTIIAVVALLILGMGTLVGVNLALNRQLVETPASVCAPNNQTEKYCSAGATACHKCIGNEWQEVGLDQCGSLTCTPCGGAPGGGDTTCATGGDAPPPSGSCSVNTCSAGANQFVRHFICSTPLGPNGRCEPQEPGVTVISDTGDNRNLTTAFFQNDPCTSEQIDLFTTANGGDPYETGFITAITRDKTSTDCGTVTNTPTPTLPGETPTITPTPTPGLAQCQQVVVQSITRGETEVAAPVASKIQKGDVVVFRATAGNSTSTPVESITFQLSIGGQAQATVVAPANQQAGGEYVADYEVTISQAASYVVTIVSIQTL